MTEVNMELTNRKRMEAVELYKDGFTYAEISEKLNIPAEVCNDNLVGVKAKKKIPTRVLRELRTQKKKTTQSKSKFVVYSAEIDGEVVYIGEGLSGRENHCTSGTSSVYGLNHAVFSGVNVELKILGNLETKEEAEELEAKLIYELNPRFNKYCPRSKTRFSNMLKLYIEDVIILKYKMTHTRKNTLIEIINSPYEKVVAAWESTLSSNYICRLMRTDDMFADIFEYSNIGKKLNILRLKKSFIDDFISYYKDKTKEQLNA